MQARQAAITDHLAARAPIALRHLIWLSARNRASGAIESIGFWTGDDHADVVVDGQTRTYLGAGGVIEMSPITHGTGTDVRTVRAVLSPMAPEVELALRGYEPRGAAVEIHRIIQAPATGLTVGNPVRRLKGWVSAVSIVSGGEGREGKATLTIASNARAGTRTLALKKSDESQKLRQTATGVPDRFYRYASISGAVEIDWGEDDD